jgi:hypothetical protein
LETCLIPFRLESSSSVEFGSRKPPLENPLTHTTKSLPAPFARPPEVARRGLFLSAIFRAPRKGTSEAKADRDARRWPRGRGAGEGGQRRPQMAARSRGRRRRTETPADGRAVAGRLAPWWTASLVAVAAIASAGWLARRPSTSLSEVVSGNGGFYTCVTRGSGAARAQRAP